MNLSEFVSETLRQIADGVKAADDHFVKSGVNAEVIPTNANSRGMRNKSDWIEDYRDIEFDVAVTVTDSSGATKGGNAGLQVSVFSIGAKGESSNEQARSSVTRLKFIIPLKYPTREKQSRTAGN